MKLFQKSQSVQSSANSAETQPQTFRLDLVGFGFTVLSIRIEQPVQQSTTTATPFSAIRAVAKAIL